MGEADARVVLGNDSAVLGDKAVENMQTLVVDVLNFYLTERAFFLTSSSSHSSVFKG